MNFSKKIISVIKDAEKNKANLTLEETISVINAFKNVSESKKLLEKTVFLLLLIHKKFNHTQKLTQRETQIFNLIGLGFNSQEISSLLTISKETVGTHRKNIIKKLSLKGSGKLQKAAFQYAHENFTS
ncbi:response regulator transcription factor [Rasiella sp. SM2506]|uniref:response regulator transcription factor n=1 Tax=Rasiella sp. SM2506 TaxID=3423914 RepID=UPI003D7BB626